MRTKHRFEPVNLKSTQSAWAQARLEFKVRQQEDELVIDVHDVIGEDFFGFGVSAADIVPQIRAANVPIRLSINSPGGSVFDAVAIHSQLAQHNHPVTADIVGQAASAATIISSAADEIRIAAAGEYMIHRAMLGLVIYGNEDELALGLREGEALRQRLIQIDNELQQILAERSGKTLEEVRELEIGEAGDGTYFTGRQAVEEGFADELLPARGKKAAAKAQREVKVSAVDAAFMRGASISLARMRAASRS